jgi:hypothetical protein
MKRFILTSLVVAPGLARGATFPPDNMYVPFACGHHPMTDKVADTPNFLDEKDLVGDTTQPAGLRAADNENLYIRIRVNHDPAPGGALRPFSWGIELDTDGDYTTYEVLLIVDNLGPTAATVNVYTNHTVTLPNDPNDPADTPASATFPFTANGRTVAAAVSMFGGDGDFFVDFAVPWTALADVGVKPNTPVSVWVASSNSHDSLDGDFACHDGATGAPQLGGIVSDPTVSDPTVDTDGDGFTDAQEIAAGSDPNDPNSVPSTMLEGGGGGCSSGHGGGLAVALAAVALRRRRPTSGKLGG